MTGPDEAMPVDQWLLRSPAGQQYGPVSFDTIRAWAAQNRFTAGYGISANGSEWRPVEAVPELGMDWFVEPGDGSRYGPFHPLALLDYIREGAVPPETKVIHKTNGGEARAYQVLLEAVVDAIDQTREVQTELVRQIQSLQERLEERDRWFAGENKTLQEERERRQELELAVRRLEEQGTQSASLQAHLTQAESELARLRKSLDTECRAHQETRARLEQDLRAGKSEADRRIRDLEQQAAAAQEKGEGARREKELLAGQLAAERQGRETERAALAEQGREAEAAIRQSRDEALRLKRDFESRLNQAETQAAEAAAAASRAEAQVATLQSRAERMKRDAEQAETATRTASEIRSEAQSLAAALKASELERAALHTALEKERQAMQELRAEAQARLASEASQREAAGALSREITVLRREVAALQHQVESSRVDADEHSRTGQELAQLRQTVLALKKKMGEGESAAITARTELDEAREREAKTAREAAALSERAQADRRQLESERDRQVSQAALLSAKIDRLESDLESGRDRIRVLEARLAERPAGDAKPKAAWSGPITDIPAEEPAPPPRKAPNLAGLEARAQAELKAWQEKKQTGPKTESPPKGKSWIPWK